jgi:hypothetical protein
MIEKNSNRWLSPTLIFSGSTIFASIFAVFAISKGDVNTTLLILQRIQPIKLVTGVMASSFPILITYSILGLLKLNQTHSYSYGRRMIVFPAVFILISVSFLAFSFRTNLFLSIYFLILFNLFIYSITGFSYRKFAKKKILGWRNEKNRSLGMDFWYGIPSIILLAFIGNWLPIEQLNYQEKVLVGYVISQENGEVVFLEDSNRKITYLKAERITSRSLCERRQFSLLSSFNTSQGKYPTCK